MNKITHRKTIDLFCKYEGIKQKYGRDCTYSELGRIWEINKMMISRWYTGFTQIPESRLVWAMRRFRNNEDFIEEFIAALLNDYSAARLKEII